MKNKPAFFFLIGCLLCMVATLSSLLFGSLGFSFTDLWKNLTGGQDGATSMVFYYARLPRTLAALFSGAALAVAGGVLQTVLSNKLASPGIIGVNAGAGFGVTLCCALGLLSGWAVSLFAFCGSLLAVLVLSLFAARTFASKTTVILGGVALNSILNALSESVSVLFPDAAMLTTEFRVGGFSAISYSQLVPAAILILSALILLLFLSNELDVLALGDETAKSVGLCVRKYRMVFLTLAALLAGAAVSFSGLLGFVGLIVPHTVRKFSGNESRYFLPLTALFGAGFVCLCDSFSRLLFQPYELPVGILMSAIGGPIFVALLVNMKGGRKQCSK